jgi:arginyl-tRNA synthetase
LAKNTAALEYKGHPLRRKDNLIYYGSMSDKYIIMLQITETKKVKDLDVATHVIVQLQRTDPDIKSKDRVVKKSEKSGLYEAMDIATVWLDRALTAE